MPAQILDLHAEFRCLTSGLLAPGDYRLADALANLGLEGDGVEGLARLLRAIQERLDMPRALLRGRYLVVWMAEGGGTPGG